VVFDVMFFSFGTSKSYSSLISPKLSDAESSLKFFLKVMVLDLFVFILCVWMFWLHVCVHYVFAWCLGGGGGGGGGRVEDLILRYWSYRQLLDTLWVLGI
jgi:hypothetical protein